MTPSQCEFKMTTGICIIQQPGNLELKLWSAKPAEVLLNKKAHRNTTHTLKYAVQEQPKELEIFTPSVCNTARTSCWAGHFLWTGACFKPFFTGFKRNGAASTLRDLLTDPEDFWHGKYCI